MKVKKLMLLLTGLLLVVTTFAQRPGEIPGPNPPIDFSNPYKIALYLIGPVLMVLVFLWWNKRTKKDE